jgi:DNA helicase HerA-like ATPase
MQPFPLCLHVRPARASSVRDLPALETVLAGLALDEHTPIALEIAASPTERQFLLRAEQPAALRHLEQQIQARYPQAIISAVVPDPLICASGESCSVVELRPGAASYLPLRSWKAREITTEGTDPLLGILASFGSLPEGTRAVAQLALVPAPPQWSAPNRRYAVEHPLQKEHAHVAGGTQERSIKDVLLLFPAVLLLLLVYLFHGLVPAWLMQAVLGLLRGQTPHLTTSETMVVILGGGVLLVLVFGGMYLAMVLLGRFGTPRIYDQRLVEEKTARPAYRVRLRLFVFMADPHASTAPAPRGLRSFGQVRQMLQVWDARGKRDIHSSDVRTWWKHLRTDWRAQRRLAREKRADQHAREAILRTLAASYRQYHLAAGGYFLPRTLSQRHVNTLLAPPERGWLTHAGWASDLLRSAHYLSVADLAALWHLPQAEDLPDLVYVEHSTIRTLLAPSALAKVQGYKLGTSTHAGQTIPVFLPFACLLQNLLAAASTGKGKSNLFAHLMRAFALGRLQKRSDVPDGALVIDPHGDLAHRVASSLPPALSDDVILIDLADRDYPIAFNPLDMSGGKDRDKIIDNLIQVVESLWPTSYGPRTESFLEYSCKTLAEANARLIANDPLTGPDLQYTLLDVVSLLRRTSFRNAVLEHVKDPFLLNWWHHYYELLDARQQADFTSSLITKLSKFSSSRIISRIVGQPRSTIDLSEIIRQNKIVLFDCASGEIGADMAALFGSLFVGFFQAALQEQARLPVEERHRFLVLIDEFQALAGINYQSMLAELRKYGGSFALATQSLAYLDRFERTLRATVMANTEHLFAFAMADEDARLLHLPGIEPDDITQLSTYTCYARISLSGERLPVFSMLLDAPEPEDPSQRRTIVDRCRARYGRPVGDVDWMLRECLARQEGASGQGSGWDLEGVETVAEAMERIKNKRKRGSGATKKAGKETEGGSGGEEGTPQHVMYDDVDDLSLE